MKKIAFFTIAALNMSHIAWAQEAQPTEKKEEQSVKPFSSLKFSIRPYIGLSNADLSSTNNVEGIKINTTSDKMGGFVVGSDFMVQTPMASNWSMIGGLGVEYETISGTNLFLTIKNNTIFIAPKLGAQYQFNPEWGIYALAGYYYGASSTTDGDIAGVNISDDGSTNSKYGLDVGADYTFNSFFHLGFSLGYLGQDVNMKYKIIGIKEEKNASGSNIRTLLTSGFYF